MPDRVGVDAQVSRHVAKTVIALGDESLPVDQRHRPAHDALADGIGFVAVDDSGEGGGHRLAGSSGCGKRQCARGGEPDAPPHRTAPVCGRRSARPNSPAARTPFSAAT